MTTTKKGDIGEVVAIKYLQKHGYQILDTNFKFSRFWEIDIIAEHQWYTIFIEVKYRTNDRFWLPEESITPGKLFKFRKTMEYYCQKYRIDFESIRFDVIAIIASDHKYTITHYKNREI